eukprot:TRINITY_DN15907_c0_g1_i1.p1 TRINITY_DN15907_c0_g1~~TRINITY_DN15907_c0_g1_i1.p1  ORF type:complete len:682 (+),score=174.28 TRINITY_DN15907_c0_g1_i1:164-2209(+)
MLDDDAKSVGSRVSKGSRTSKSSVRSVMSRASSLGASLRRGISSLTPTSRSTTRSVAELVDLRPGQACETVALVTMREEESMESARVGDIPAGQLLEVLEVGEGRRLKIKTSAGTVGWVSTKTKMNEVLIMKRMQEVEAALVGWEVGGQHEVKFKVTLRAGEGLDSSVLGELAPGTVFTIRELGSENGRRALVQAGANGQTTGWISLVTKQGEVLAGKVSGKEKDRSTGMFGTSSTKIREMLESARAGDLDKLQKILDPPSIMSKLSGKPNINMSDIRGRSALIYAASSGHLRVVQYLLSKTGEINVNGVDDTEKTALHHAAKRAVNSPQDENVSSQIVNTLLVCKAHLEARDHNGCTPLIFAVANGNEIVTKALMLANANVNASDTERHSCLSYAKQFGHQRILGVLEKAGAREVFSLDEDDEDDVPVSPVSQRSSVVIATTISTGYCVGVTESSAPQTQGGTFDSLSTRATDNGSAAALPVAVVVGEEEAASSEAASMAKKKKSVVKKKTKNDGDENAEGAEPADAEVAAAADASEASAAVIKKKKSVVKAKEGDDADVKKPVKKKKSVAASKGMTAAMMEAVDADGLTVAVAADAEGVDAKSLALEKLTAVIASTTSPKELKKCIEAAQAQGATDEDLAQANDKLKALKAASAKRKSIKEAKELAASAEAPDASGEAS